MAAGGEEFERRLAELEAQVKQARDHLAILNLVGSYGPLVDSGSADEVLALYAEGGTFHQGLAEGGFAPLGREALHGVYAGDDLMAMVAGGCSHFNAAPRISIDGDSARAVGFSLVLVREGERWIVSRAAINDWRLVREAGGWRIRDRYNHAVDGSVQSREIMRRVSESASGPDAGAERERQ